MNDLVPHDHVFEQRSLNWKKAAAPVGAALLLVALGWGAGAKIDGLRGPSPERLAAQTALQAAQANAEKALQAQEAQRKQIADLNAHVEGLKGKLEAQAQKARESEASVAALQKSLADEKAQSQVLHARIDRMQTAAIPQPPARPVDRAATASIAKPLPVPASSATTTLAQKAQTKPKRVYRPRDDDGYIDMDGERGGYVMMDRGYGPYGRW